MKLTYLQHGIESSLKIKVVVESKKYLDKLYNLWLEQALVHRHQEKNFLKQGLSSFHQNTRME